MGNMYPPHHFGGYELVWRSAVEHLRRAGHEARVLTTDLRTPEALAVRDQPAAAPWPETTPHVQELHGDEP